MTEVLNFMSTLSDEELTDEDQLFHKFLMYLSHVESHTPCGTCSTVHNIPQTPRIRGMMNEVQG